jgi:vacuolar protein-sorting-associated protein 4
MGDIRWHDIAGLCEAKEVLIQARAELLDCPQSATRCRSILLYGPPGTGKTLLGRACGEGLAFARVSASDFIPRWLGESDRVHRPVGHLVRSVGERKGVVFVDDLEALTCGAGLESARRAQADVFGEVDALRNSKRGVLLLAATNAPWTFRPAALRRFEKQISVPMPDSEARAELLTQVTSRMVVELTDDDVRELAQLTDGYTGADIVQVCREAGMPWVRAVQQAEYFRQDDENNLRPCGPDDPGAVKVTLLEMTQEQIARLQPPPILPGELQLAVQRIRPSIPPSDLKQFEDWTAEQNRHRPASEK